MGELVGRVDPTCQWREVDQRVCWLCGRHVYDARRGPSPARSCRAESCWSWARQNQEVLVSHCIIESGCEEGITKGGGRMVVSRTTAKQVKNGRMDLEIVVLDAEGQIVAISNHIALAVDSQRNLAKRNTGNSKM